MDPSVNDERRARRTALAADVRPELHRYCARLMGSVIEGEDVVQDTLLRAVVALQDDTELPPLRPWLFKVAHNRALDLLRGRAVRIAEPLDDVPQIAAGSDVDPLQAMLRMDVVRTAVARFVELPVLQRSVVVLKDVLDEPLADIASLLDVSVDSVKSHLARGRARLRDIGARTDAPARPPPPSEAALRYVALFNRRDWDALRSLLAEDVRLHQSTHPLRSGRADVGTFFSIYARSPEIRLAPAWLEGREVLAVQEAGSTGKPDYVMWLEWTEGRIAVIHDYRYARYLLDGAGLLQ